MLGAGVALKVRPRGMIFISISLTGCTESPWNYWTCTFVLSAGCLYGIEATGLKCLDRANITFELAASK